jgi:hypothetical protein
VDGEVVDGSLVCFLAPWQLVGLQTLCGDAALLSASALLVGLQTKSKREHLCKESVPP